ncbi:FecR family protein [Flavobacteriaceae bacterium LMO-SS05]|jgi:ferric-dicitrate binding protein FerR (iron transport regulator)
MKKEHDILKWFDDELSASEVKDLKQSENLETLEKIAHYASYLEAPKVDTSKALESFKAKHPTKNVTKVINFNFRTVLKVAAVLAIMFASSYFVFFNNQKSFVTKIAQTQTINLPDNSEVILNAKSKLVYNSKTWKDHRDLDLDGEAFFKVSKGQTFSVHTDAGVIQVLGTQFNVKERDHYFEVHCYEGLVSVTYNNETIKLPKGNIFRVINGVKENIVDQSVLNPSWIQRESSFNNVPLEQIVAELERQYDINIHVKDINVAQLFTGSFTHEDKNLALQSVTIPLKLSYKIDGKNVVFYQYNGK